MSLNDDAETPKTSEEPLTIEQVTVVLSSPVGDTDQPAESIADPAAAEQPMTDSISQPDLPSTPPTNPAEADRNCIPEAVATLPEEEQRSADNADRPMSEERVEEIPKSPPPSTTSLLNTDKPTSPEDKNISQEQSIPLPLAEGRTERPAPTSQPEASTSKTNEDRQQVQNSSAESDVPIEHVELPRAEGPVLFDSDSETDELLTVWKHNRPHRNLLRISDDAEKPMDVLLEQLADQRLEIDLLQHELKRQNIYGEKFVKKLKEVEKQATEDMVYHAGLINELQQRIEA
ncbi:uncharacterized protein LOC131025939 [Salvia miltiorrhiza]|uniref:uncharacterized protein LOC131025939 n=1 Tax=Salvia miltiorrhiza TaxID=226208 RepID=UPI0025ABC4BE|nr:uncharacterized protein LOC131025939 [Salvia miltiorrhiza]